MQNHPHGARLSHHGRIQGVPHPLPALRHTSAPIHGAGHGYRPCAQGSPPIYAPRPTPHLMPLVLWTEPPVVPLPRAHAVVACSFHPRTRGETTNHRDFMGVYFGGLAVYGAFLYTCAITFHPQKVAVIRTGAPARAAPSTKAPLRGFLISHGWRIYGITRRCQPLAAYLAAPAACRPLQRSSRRPP